MFSRGRGPKAGGGTTSQAVSDEQNDPAAKGGADVKVVPNIADLASADTANKRVKENLERFQQLFGADEDAYQQPTTSKKELWAYYLYYNGVSSPTPWKCTNN